MTIDFRNTSGGSKPAVIEALSVVENGIYTPAEGIDGYSPVEVNVPEKVFSTEEKTVSITSNGQTIVDKTASVDGMTRVTVDVEVPAPAPRTEVRRLKFYRNGKTEITPSKGYDGISRATIEVKSPVDFGAIGYMEEDVRGLNAEIAYSEAKMAGWDPNRTEGQGFVNEDREIVYFPKVDTSNLTNMTHMFQNCKSLKVITDLNVGKVTNMHQAFGNCSSIEEIELAGGILPECTGFDSMFDGVAENGTLFYTIPGDYSPVLKVLPQSWSAIPVGRPDIVIRVVKDGMWLTSSMGLKLGDNIPFRKNHNNTFKASIIIRKGDPMPNLKVMLDGVEIGEAKLTTEVQTIVTGDTSNILVKKTGADILTLVPEGGNTDNWAYDSVSDSIKSPTVSQFTYPEIRLSIPDSFTITFQQDNSGSDWGKLLNGSGHEIADFTGLQTPEPKEFSGSTDDGVLKVVYNHLSSSDVHFYIKSLSYIDYSKVQ